MDRHQFFESSVISSHYVPQCILKNFAYNDDGMLHAYEYENAKKPFKSMNTRVICNEKYFYNFKQEQYLYDAKQTYSLENLFKLIEDNCCPIIRRINDQGVSYKLDEEDIKWLLMYHCSQIYRNPHFFRASQEFEKNFVKCWLSVYCRSSEGRQLALKQGIDEKLFSELLNYIDNLDTDLAIGSNEGYVKLSFDKDYFYDQTLERIITTINNVNMNPKKYLEKFQVKLVYSEQDAFIINDCGVGVLQDVFILPLTPNLILMSQTVKDNSRGYFNNITNASTECIEEVNKVIYNSQKKFIFSNHEHILRQIANLGKEH